MAASQWPRDRYADLIAFYGNPNRDGDASADPAWEKNNLVLVKCPWPLVAAWDVNLSIRGMRVHNRCAQSLQVILKEIFNIYKEDPEACKKARLHLFGGGFMFRSKRGGVALSTHAFGAAIDMDPERNPLGKRWRERAGMMPREVVDIFEDHGWVWGGRFSRGDAMHFQAARLG